MKHSIYTFFIALAVSCQAQKIKTEKLENVSPSLWEWKIDENCINSLRFVDENSYIEYMCELGESVEGKYSIKNDTIILTEKSYTSNVPGKGETVEFEYKMVLTLNGLTQVYSRTFVDGQWKNTWIENPEVFFVRNMN